jgi:hypothetical protein
MKLIGLAGHAGSGKDEAAKALFPLGYERVAFADAVRRAALAIDPVIVGTSCNNLRLSEFVALVGWQEAKREAEVRRLLQVIGTEAGRDIHGRDCWIKATDRDVANFRLMGRGVVITDVRFSNEARYIQKQGGKVYLIQRPGVGPRNEHASEKLGFDVDGVIVNDGSIDELHRWVLFHAGESCVHEGKRGHWMRFGSGDQEKWVFAFDASVSGETSIERGAMT